MNCEPEINLWNHSQWNPDGKMPPSITPFLLDGDDVRPAVLVIPGGGYGGVCEASEGSPIARAFNQLGFQAFVLNYRVAPHRYPEPQQDAFRAMKMIRGNAEKWHVDPARVSACGFSAGGHLAASIGTLDEAEMRCDENDRFDAFSGRPDALILCYPVISLAPGSHFGTGMNLFGELTEENVNKGSLQRHVGAHTPPAFLWHTVRDQIVPFRNSVLFAEAMAEAKRPCELHLFPFGDHGMLLGLDTFDVVQWPLLAKHFLETQWRAAAEAENALRRYTNAYQYGCIQKAQARAQGK